MARKQKTKKPAAIRVFVARWMTGLDAEAVREDGTHNNDAVDFASMGSLTLARTMTELKTRVSAAVAQEINDFNQTMDEDEPPPEMKPSDLEWELSPGPEGRPGQVWFISTGIEVVAEAYVEERRV